MRLLAAVRGAVAGARGFSVTEVMTVLTAMSTLTAVGATAVEDYVAQARMIKAVSDGRTIQVGLVRLTSEVGASDRRATGWDVLTLLVGDGAGPVVGPEGDPEWGLPVGGRHVGRLNDHLVTNAAGYQAGPAGQRTWGGWRGPYVDGPVGADPWGHRFAVNVRWLTVATSFDTVVLSAGPDGVIDTRFGRDGLTAATDDLLTLVSSGS